MILFSGYSTIPFAPACLSCGRICRIVLSSIMVLTASQVSSDSDEIDVLGYCFGGVLSLLTAAARPEIPIWNLSVVATPIDLSAVEGVIRALARGQLEADAVLDETRPRHAWPLLSFYATKTPRLASYASGIDGGPAAKGLRAA